MIARPPELLRHHSGATRAVPHAIVDRARVDRRRESVPPAARQPTRSTDQLPALGDRAIRAISEVTFALSTSGPMHRRDPRIVALLEALEALGAGVRRVDRRTGSPSRVWLAGRDGALVTHALEPDTLWSACGMVGFTDVERRDWRSVSGPRCLRCEGEAW